VFSVTALHIISYSGAAFRPLLRILKKQNERSVYGFSGCFVHITLDELVMHS